MGEIARMAPSHPGPVRQQRPPDIPGLRPHFCRTRLRPADVGRRGPEGGPGDKSLGGAAASTGPRQKKLAFGGPRIFPSVAYQTERPAMQLTVKAILNAIQHFRDLCTRTSSWSATSWAESTDPSERGRPCRQPPQVFALPATGPGLRHLRPTGMALPAIVEHPNLLPVCRPRGPLSSPWGGSPARSLERGQGQGAVLLRRRRGPQQQNTSGDQKVLRLSHLQSDENGLVSHVRPVAGATLYPQILLRRRSGSSAQFVGENTGHAITHGPVKGSDGLGGIARVAPSTPGPVRQQRPPDIPRLRPHFCRTRLRPADVGRRGPEGGPG